MILCNYHYNYVMPNVLPNRRDDIVERENTCIYAISYYSDVALVLCGITIC